MDTQFFARTDHEVEGPPRDLVGYGETPPRVEWPGGAKVAVQIVVNYEEGSEKSFPMGDEVNDFLTELPFTLEGQRDLTFESMYEYGSRAGIWRLFRVFDAAEVPVTFFAAAVALERNIDVARRIASRGDEVAGHGYRWSNAYEMTREEEAEAIKKAVQSIEQTTGYRPRGWYHREMSTNTRELVVEHGGFAYDSECYNDDLPYWTEVLGRQHLVVPYTLTVNDVRYVLSQGFSTQDDFYSVAMATFDRLRNEGDGVNRMMSVGLHPRLSGQPARSAALERFIRDARATGDAWFTRRIDIAETFMEQVSAEEGLALLGG